MEIPQETYEEVLRKYERRIENIARLYYLEGADREDVIQEGMIGGFKAIRDFKPNGGSSFPTFLTLCVHRNIQTAVKQGGREKHQPLNQANSLEQPDQFIILRNLSLEETIEGTKINPQNLITIKNSYLEFLDKLSPFEYHCYILRVKGDEYSEIAESLDCKIKSVDNALDRAQRKQSIS